MSIVLLACVVIVFTQRMSEPVSFSFYSRFTAGSLSVFVYYLLENKNTLLIDKRRLHVKHLHKYFRAVDFTRYAAEIK